MDYTRKTIEDLRRYIAKCDDRAALEEVDTLLAMALEEVRKRLSSKAHIPKREKNDNG